MAVFAGSQLRILEDLHDEYGWGFNLLASCRYIISHLSVACLCIYILLFGVLDDGQLIYFQV